MKKTVVILSLVVTLAGFMTLSAHATGLIAAGSTVTYNLTNMPTGLTDGTPIPTTFLGGLTTVGDVQVFTVQTATAGGGEWDDFFFSTADGAPIGTNPNAFWQIVTNFTLTQAVNFDGIEDQWTTGGANPPNGLGGTPVPATSLNENFINFVGTGPLGDGFVNGFGTAGVGVFPFSDPLPAGLTDFPQFVSPYSFATTGGGVPADANGFNLALHFDPQTPTATPEPGTMILMGLGLAGVAAMGRRRRMKSAS